MSKRIRSKEREHDVSPTQQHQQQFIYIEIPVNKEDTLIVLSMKYNVSVPELKRLNSLLNDRDIFALNLIKIPIKPNSIFFHQFNDQLKYGEPNMTRLTNRLDSSLERELADSKLKISELEAEKDINEMELKRNKNNQFQNSTKENMKPTNQNRMNNINTIQYN
jgi:LysM repeat protein